MFQKRKLTLLKKTLPSFLFLLSKFMSAASSPSMLNCRPQPEPARPVYLLNTVTKLFPRIKSRAPVWRGLLGLVKGGGDSAGCPLFHKLNYWNVLFPPVWYKTRGGSLTISGCFPNPGEDLRRNYKEVGCLCCLLVGFAELGCKCIFGVDSQSPQADSICLG